MTDSFFVVVPFPVHPDSPAGAVAVWEQLHLPYRLEQRHSSLIHPGAGGPVPMVIAHGGYSPDMVTFVRAITTASEGRTRVLALVPELTEESETELFYAGANDVLGLPASSHRVKARLQANYRQTVQQRLFEGPVLHRGELTIHLGRREVTLDGRTIALTKTEFDLFSALAVRPRRVLSRSELANSSVGHDYMGSRALESHLSRLRSKIVGAGGPRLVESVRGVGYRLGTP